MKRNFLNKIKIDNNSTLPIIIKIINEILGNKLKLLKSKSFKPYIDELTVFIIVNIPSLKDTSNSILEIVNKRTIENNEIIKIMIDKKFLLSSALSVSLSINETLLRYTWFGFAWDNKLFNENLVKFNNFISLKPELVEKKDPPIITNNMNRNDKFGDVFVKDIPKLETLLQIETKVFKKVFS